LPSSPVQPPPQTQTTRAPQVQIFFALLASLTLKSKPEEGGDANNHANIDRLLVSLTFIPIATVVLSFFAMVAPQLRWPLEALATRLGWQAARAPQLQELAAAPAEVTRDATNSGDHRASGVHDLPSSWPPGTVAPESESAASELTPHTTGGAKSPDTVKSHAAAAAASCTPPDGSGDGGGDQVLGRAPTDGAMRI